MCDVRLGLRITCLRAAADGSASRDRNKEVAVVDRVTAALLWHSLHCFEPDVLEVKVVPIGARKQNILIVPLSRFC